MRRRRALAALAASSLGATAGCLDALGAVAGAGGDPAIDGATPTLAPGDERTLVVDASAVDELQFTAHCDRDDAVTLDVGAADLAPGPSYVQQSYPPIWHWDYPVNVTLELPVRVAPDADAGGCEYGLAAAQGEGDRLERRFAIAVDA